jgi:hypothetical protein
VKYQNSKTIEKSNLLRILRIRLNRA